MPLEKCTRFLQKNGRNIPKACENLDVKYLPCVAHSINLVVGTASLQKKEDILEKDWMFEGNKPNAIGFSAIRFADVNVIDEEIESLWTEVANFVDSAMVNRDDLETVRCVVHRFRKLAVFFHRSQKGAFRLKQLQKNRPDMLDVAMDFPTNWRSTMVMLTQLIHLRPALDAFFEYLHSDAGVEEFSESTRTKLFHPTSEDWLMVQCLEELLAQFGALIDEMRRSKNASLGLALPGIRALKVLLQDKAIFDPVSASVVKVEFELKVRATILSVCQTIARLLEASFGDLSANLPVDFTAGSEIYRHETFNSDRETWR